MQAFNLIAKEQMKIQNAQMEAEVAEQKKVELAYAEHSIVDQERRIMDV
jgi:hypothetical protein